MLDLPYSGTTEMADALLPTAVLANTDCFLRELYDFFARAWVYSFRK
ncbi:N-formylglutamate amidohydrolase [Lactobacillus delbrueckii subsp. bulgaricus]|nr:N-formylglutamate amidohydrolase [Lactobacillus delbrueckii subsp. bulgaricus]